MSARSVFWALLILAAGLAFIPSLAAGVAALCLLCMAVGVGIGGVLEWV